MSSTQPCSRSKCSAAKALAMCSIPCGQVSSFSKRDHTFCSSSVRSISGLSALFRNCCMASTATLCTLHHTLNRAPITHSYSYLMQDGDLASVSIVELTPILSKRTENTLENSSFEMGVVSSLLHKTANALVACLE